VKFYSIINSLVNFREVGSPRTQQYELCNHFSNIKFSPNFGFAVLVVLCRMEQPEGQNVGENFELMDTIA
jgi:hypothetical protein